MHSLTLGTSTIRLHDGLYSLNDLHKAAGGEEHQRPNQFIRLDQTQALIAEIETDPCLCVESPPTTLPTDNVCSTVFYCGEQCRKGGQKKNPKP